MKTVLLVGLLTYAHLTQQWPFSESLQERERERVWAPRKQLESKFMALSRKIVPTPHLIKCCLSNCVGINGVAMSLFPYKLGLQTDLWLARVVLGTDSTPQAATLPLTGEGCRGRMWLRPRVRLMGLLHPYCRLGLTVLAFMNIYLPHQWLSCLEEEEGEGFSFNTSEC